MIDISTYINKLEVLKEYIDKWIRSHHTTMKDWYPALPFHINMETEPPQTRYFTFEEYYQSIQ